MPGGGYGGCNSINGAKGLKTRLKGNRKSEKLILSSILLKE